MTCYWQFFVSIGYTNHKWNNNFGLLIFFSWKENICIVMFYNNLIYYITLFEYLPI